MASKPRPEGERRAAPTARPLRQRPLWTDLLRSKDALRESEERLWALVGALEEGVVFFDAQGRLLAFNPSAQRILGLSAEELDDKPEVDTRWPAIHEDGSPFLPEQFPAARTLRTGVALREIPLGIFRHGRSIVWLSVNTRPLFKPGRSRPYGVVSSFNDVTERRRADEELAKSLEELRRLTIHLQHVREVERKHMAREIHDDLGHALTSLKLDVSSLLEEGAHPVRRDARLRTMVRSVDSMIERIRGIATRLRPAVLDSLGLFPALEWKAREFQRRIGIPCEYSAAGQPPITDEGAIQVFRVFEEALENVARHARATRVSISATVDEGGFVLRVRDNGVGLPSSLPGGSLGIVGMRERASLLGGSLTFASRRGRGTTVILRVPLQPETPA